MPHTAVSNSVIRQLQLVFSISTVLLLISLAASYFSIQRLIENSKLVNHTNQVLLEAENIISFMKDAETGQRGYLATLDPVFLQPYTGSYEKVTRSYNQVRELTGDNPAQLRSLDEIKHLYEYKFVKMRRLIALNQRGRIRQDSAQRYADMLAGKHTMDSLRVAIARVQTTEQALLNVRVKQQQIYITATPYLLLLAAIISILITVSTYFRIKRDLDERLVQQRLAEQQYLETTRRIGVLEDLTQHIADGQYAARSQDTQDDELGRIGKALNQMATALEQTFTELKAKNWLQTGAVRLSDAIRGEKNIHQLASRLIHTLTDYVGAPLGTVYFQEGGDTRYTLAGSYATRQAPATLLVGEGLVGQAVSNRKPIVVDHLPAGYHRVSSSLGETHPTSLLITPLLHDGRCVGVIELGMLQTPDPLTVEFLTHNQEALAISISAALDYIKLQNLLEETQVQSEELQTQHSELENLNTELEMHTQRLQASEEELRVQQEELQQTNAELEERGLLLEERNTEIQQKADELELATRYKSEFLANMSHELRTPLNSILLLSRLLAENTDENLTGDQVEYAKVIQSSGNGLLGLIDEILDLSKIEAGQMQLDYQPMALADLTDELQALFGLLAKEKGIDLSITVAPDAPTTINTDRMRLGQILKNLLSNALKFTTQGSVSLMVQKHPTRSNRLCFAVQDTGIGIPPDKQPLVFEAFQQADGSTKRKYGGTGLGLSISRELAKLLGGEITLVSEVGKGSTFTVQLPLATEDTAVAPVPPRPSPLPATPAPPVQPQATTESIPTNRYLSTVIPEAIPDDRHTLTEQDKTILIIEDDPGFAKSLLDYARRKSYKGIVAVRGDEGLALASAFKPQGILLDIQLPIMSGWEVMDALKADPQTRPIPVHIMSSHKFKNESLLKGAVAFLDKPVAFDQLQEVFQKIEYVLSRDTKKVLIIEDNKQHAKALAYFLETFNISSELKSSVAEGVDALKRKEVDCVILDMGVPDHKAYETLEEAKKNPGLENLPIIIFTGKSLSMAEELKIKRYADSIIVKTAHSYQRMLDEVSLFLHLVEEKTDTRHTGASKKLQGLSQVLQGKTVLIADDDVRNIFSLSKALEQYGMNVVAALNGEEALQKLHETPTVDLVLLDMMMPQLDGYETARKIREQYQWRSLPVIAVTAKAMTGDRDKCIQAGASDYITKPVDIDQLVSLLRVWLYDQA